jgi:hypothetical protein
MVHAVVTTMQPEEASAMQRDSNGIGIDIAKHVFRIIGPALAKVKFSAK